MKKLLNYLLNYLLIYLAEKDFEKGDHHYFFAYFDEYSRLYHEAEAQDHYDGLDDFQ
jgi:hypothetical protein